MADSHKTMRCPACGTEMQKVFIPSQGINIDICSKGCGGIFFDNREFSMFDEKDEPLDDIIQALENNDFKPVDESLPRYCPACGAKMAKNYSSIKKQIQVDECYACGGKFLDHGELTAIRNEYENDIERTNDVMKYVYNEIGIEIIHNEAAEAKRKASPLKRLFDKMIGL